MRWWNLNPNIKALAAEMSRVIYYVNNEPVVIASTGRSGSTMLCRAIMNSYFQSRTKLSINPRFVFYPAFCKKNLSYYRHGGVYKTHMLATHVPNELKTIFIYDDPVISYKSFNNCVVKYGSPWGEQHLKNLESRYSISDLGADVDILNYKEQMSSWFSRKSGVVIRFSELWDNTEDLSDYIGVNLKLPLLTERTSSISEADVLGNTLNELRNIYDGATKVMIK